MNQGPPIMDGSAKGGSQAIDALLQQEQTPLFDYLLRMCGDRARCEDGVYECMRIIKAESHNFPSLEIVRTHLYQKARQRLFDIWNADTSALHEEVTVGELPKSVSVLSQKLMALPGPQREVLLLRYRSRLESDTIARIMNESAEKIAETKQAAVAAMGPLTEEDVTIQVGGLPSHQIVYFSDHTHDIAELAGAIQERVQLWNHLTFAIKTAILLLLIIIAVIVLFKPSIVFALLKLVSHK